MKKNRVALFIDAENASASGAKSYLDRCHELGDPVILRCYGGPVALQTWVKAMADYRIMPMLTPPSAKKANASDFALTIDAVSLLHRELFDHAVIASSDTDFIQLTMHIREYGRGVEAMQGPIKKAAVKSPTANKAPAKKAAAADNIAQPVIETEKLLQVFHEAEKPGVSLKLQSFGTALAAKMPPNYRRGHGSLTNYIKKSGIFDIKKSVITLKTKSAAP